MILRVRLLCCVCIVFFCRRCKCGDEGKNESILPLKGIRPPVHVDETRAESTCSCRVVFFAGLHRACSSPPQIPRTPGGPILNAGGWCSLGTQFFSPGPPKPRIFIFFKTAPGIRIGKLALHTHGTHRRTAIPYPHYAFTFRTKHRISYNPGARRLSITNCTYP